MKKKNGKNQVASTKSMEDDLIKEIQNDRRFKRRASAKAEKRIQAAANPKKSKKTKKPKRSLSPREYLVEQAKIKEAMRDAKRVPKKKPKVAKKTNPKPKAVKKPKDTLQDFIDEPSAASDNYTPPKKRGKYEGCIDSYETPFGTIKADSSDDAFNFDVEEKDGGYLKRDMMMKKRKKGGVVKRRMGGKVGGYGKALRGY
jgi:hypothetical protein